MPTSGSLKGSFADVTGLTEHRGCKFSVAFGWHPFEVDKLLGFAHWLNSQVQAVPGWHLQQRFWEFGVRGMQARILWKQAGALDGQLFQKCRSIQRVVQPPRKHKAWNECIVLIRR